MKKKILLIGSTGYIGSKLKKILSKKYKIIAPNKKKLDISKLSNLKKFVKNNIHYIINLSGQVSNNSKLMKRVIINGNKNIIKLCCDKKIKSFFINEFNLWIFKKKQK